MAFLKPRRILLRGTRAAQPAAADVAEGGLYYVTDELLMERTTGSAWQSVSPTYGAGLVVSGSSLLAPGNDTAVASTATGTQNNWAPGLVSNTTIFWSGASAIAVTGIAGGVSGQRVTFRNTGSQVATFAHNDSGSSAANRFQNLVTGGALPVAAGGFVAYVHNGTDWKQAGHDQGAWITPTFAAGDFTGSGSMTWTVASVDVTTDRYKLTGNTAMYQFYYQNTTIAGTPSTDLKRAFPALLTPKTAAEITVAWSRNLDNGTANDGFVYTFGSGGNFLFIRRDKTSGNWAASTDNTSVQATMIWEVV